MNQPLLNITNLTVKFPTRFGEFTAIDDVSLTIQPGEIHGLVGESGAGKSTIGAAIIGLLQSPGYIANGHVQLMDVDLRKLSPADYHRLRGNRISMIFQDPQTSLNPLLTIADQLVETIQQHTPMSDSDARDHAIQLLDETGIPNPACRIDSYPHQFSGGMRQRVVIALALCTNPELIIADEPTTALDVAVQKQILQLIQQLASQRKVGFLLITHDIGVIAEITHRVTVLRNGRVMEAGETAQVLGAPTHEYTQALMAAVPRLNTKLDRFHNIVKDDPSAEEEDEWDVPGASAQFASDWLLGKRNTESKTDVPSTHPILEVNNLDVIFYSNQPSWFRKRTGFQALNNISFKAEQGKTLGVVGESGSGKSTLAKAIVGLVDPATGTLSFDGEALPPGSKRSRQHPSRRRIQMVFQDPYSSLNNRRSVEAILTEPLKLYGHGGRNLDSRKLAASVLDLVEMPQRSLTKYPHQFSGGQRQRIAVARALIAQPEFLICDEPTSALDVSIQAQMLNLLKDLQTEFGLSILFISHNLAVVRQMADTVVVLKDGEMVEYAESETFFTSPQAEYSQLLLNETPSLALLE